MKKTVIVNIPMKVNVEQTAYVSEDPVLQVSDRKVKYAVNAFLEKNLKAGDELKILLLTKSDEYSHAEQNVKDFQQELEACIAGTGAAVSEYKVIDTEFQEKKSVHEQLLAGIVDSIEAETNIICDITFGPKDQTIVLFEALRFSEKHLYCEILNILYGQVNFNPDGHVENTRICDMIPLYMLGTIMGLIQESDPDQSRKMLHTLIS